MRVTHSLIKSWCVVVGAWVSWQSTSLACTKAGVPYAGCGSVHLQPSSQKAKEVGSSSGLSRLYSKLEASLWFMRLCLNFKKKTWCVIQACYVIKSRKRKKGHWAQKMNRRLLQAEGTSNTRSIFQLFHWGEEFPHQRQGKQVLLKKGGGREASTQNGLCNTSLTSSDFSCNFKRRELFQVLTKTRGIGFCGGQEAHLEKSRWPVMSMEGYWESLT